MTYDQIRVQRSLRVSGVLITIGLLTDIVTLVWEKPLAFLLFAGAGGGLVLVGIVLYLYSLIAAAAAPASASTGNSADSSS
jgi:heme A synthase